MLAKKNEVGPARISIIADSGKYKATSDTDIAIRASSPRIYESEEKKVERGKTVSFTLNFVKKQIINCYY